MGSDYSYKRVTFRRQALSISLEDGMVYEITSTAKVARPQGCGCRYCGCDGVNGKHCVMCLGLVPALVRPAQIADRHIGKLRRVLEEHGCRSFRPAPADRQMHGYVCNNPHQVDAAIRHMLAKYRSYWAKVEQELARLSTQGSDPG